MKRMDDLTLKLRKICQDIEIASDHLGAVLPEIYKEYGKDFGVYNVLYGYKERLDEMFVMIGEEIIKRRVNDGQ